MFKNIDKFTFLEDGRFRVSLLKEELSLRVDQ